MVYIISYDLGAPIQRYEELISRIKQYPSWACLGGSAYLIETNDTAVAIRDALKIFLDNDDKLFVACVTAPAAWYGYSSEVSNWILSKLQ